MTAYSVEILLPEDCELDQAGETVTVEVDESETVLSAARAQGVWLPASCQQGWCTDCAAELLDGDLDQSAAKRYYDVDAAADLVLTCVATPESDLRIRACQQAAMREHRAQHGLPPGD